MNKEKFMSALQKSLNKLSEEERNDILHDFEEHFDVGKSEGKTEEEIALSLGAPGQIAKELMATYFLEKVKNTSSTSNIFRAVWAVIGLGFFNIVIVLGPFIGLVAVMVSGWASGGAFAISPILYLLTILINPGSFTFFSLFFTIGLAGLGILLLVGMFYATRFITKLFVRYLHYNVNLVKGGMK
ncbi:DUF1700 domain-containing protein [Gracilibacillus caseinilyticus]|uniref:DUF1700 domain-containing protein n=1 Tax=Gracilibacillus caseinilyticus TaxID=2932256 RepID=A0ABY4EX94_9BACI|nr:DUF1700 domain-containing protein [Gracilibacillus caseinilyticus]UOQ48900.1 DUF1700 domain-containing protein [Gracilibacillus caseinilyticus]